MWFYSFFIFIFHGLTLCFLFFFLFPSRPFALCASVALCDLWWAWQHRWCRWHRAGVSLVLCAGVWLATLSDATLSNSLMATLEIPWCWLGCVVQLSLLSRRHKLGPHSPHSPLSPLGQPHHGPWHLSPLTPPHAMVSAGLDLIICVGKGSGGIYWALLVRVS